MRTTIRVWTEEQLGMLREQARRVLAGEITKRQAIEAVWMTPQLELRSLAAMRKQLFDILQQLKKEAKGAAP